MLKPVENGKETRLKNRIILDIYNSNVIQNYCRTLSPNDFEELKSELIIQLYKMSDDKLINHFQNNCLTYICFTIIKRIKYGTISDTGIFHKRIDDFSLHNEGFEDKIVDEDENYEQIYIDLESEIKNLHWYQGTLFRLYYVDELTLKQISEQTGINIKSVHYSIKTTRNLLKKKLQKDI